MINLKNISHFFGNKEILHDISLNVDKGEIIALLGENGAGKTTLMRICAAYLRPSAGAVFIEESNIATNSAFLRKRIGYMPEGAPLYNDMTVKSFLKFVAEAKKIASKDIKTEIERVVAIAGLEKVLFRDIAFLSKGYKRRVALAAAVTGDPDVLLLDEPAEGLDPNQKFDFKNRLKEMNKAVIISTHVLEDIKGLASKILILHKGRIQFQSSAEDLVNRDLNQLFREQTNQ